MTSFYENAVRTPLKTPTKYPGWGGPLGTVYVQWAAGEDR